MLDLNDVIVTKKERAALEYALRFGPELKPFVFSLNLDRLAQAIYVEVTGARRREMLARLTRRYIRLDTAATLDSINLAMSKKLKR